MIYPKSIQKITDKTIYRTQIYEDDDQIKQ